MKFTDACIQRPVFSSVMTYILILLGLVAYSRLQLRYMPKTEKPFITVTTQFPGAGPEIVEAQVTKVIEDAIAGVEGIDAVTSESHAEESKVVIEFNVTRDIDKATNDIYDKIRKSRDQFPDGIVEPIIAKSQSDDQPVIVVALTSSTLSASEMADYAYRDLQKRLEVLPGVSKVMVSGAGKYFMRLFLDPKKLAAYNLTVNEVMSAVKRNSVEKPGGRLMTQDREYLITTVSTIDTPEEFDRMVIADKNGAIVRLSDIGYAEIDTEDYKTRTRFNSNTAVGVSIYKQSIANQLDIAADFYKALPELRERLPKNMKLDVASDRTTFIKSSLDHVYRTLFEAIFLVILVVFFFLRSMRASMIPLVTIPVSLIGALFLIYLVGFTLNILTLLALVLAIGLVVDDAIVVLENVYRYIEDGKKPLEAAIKGVREISFAVIAMTLTLAAVYAPIALAQGAIGRLFTEFAITLAGAVLISGFAALTLSPMMCAHLLRAEDVHHHYTKPNLWQRWAMKLPTDDWILALEGMYEQGLRWALTRKRQIVYGGLAIALIGGILGKTLPAEFLPEEDQGAIVINGHTPKGSSLDLTNKAVGQLEALLKDVSEVESVITIIEKPTFHLYVQLKKDRGVPSRAVMDKMLALFKDFTMAEVKVNLQKTAFGGGGSDESGVQFVIQADKSHRELKEMASMVIEGLQHSGFFSQVYSEEKGDLQEYQLTINRDMAATLGIEPATIAETVEALLRGRKTNTFKKDNRQYDVKVEVQEANKTSPENINNIFVRVGHQRDRNEAPAIVPLSELVTVTLKSGASNLYHYNRMRATQILPKMKPSVTLEEGIQKVRDICRQVLPDDVHYEFTGDTRKFLQENQNVWFIYFLAIAFIFLVLAAQFESYIDPFIIILSVPLSIAGALVTLSMLQDGSISVYTQIGLVTLIGLITKHGILIVDFANHRRMNLKESGEDAVIAAAKLRLRPILMTTFAMILGAIPLALGGGAGFEGRRQIGWVIVGGMGFGTIFTLFVLPVVYTLIARKSKELVNVEQYATQ